MTDERDRWQAFTDTAKQLALEEPPTARPAPPKVRLAALPLVKRRVASEDEERPDSAVREIPAELASRDPRSADTPVPPLEVDTDLE